ncbi:MAG: hypothetical protein SGJ02_08480 [bacterium]|nr:hypothetical protein [bacterium]
MSGVDFPTSMASSYNAQGSDMAEWTNTAKKVGEDMAKAKSDLFTAFSQGNEADIQKNTIEYQQKERIFELFATMAKSMHDTIMGVIRKLAN